MKTELKHIGFIMDGNGRWATSRNMPRTKGHEKGAVAFENLIKIIANDDDVDQTSFYCLSTENITGRPKGELKVIFKLLKIFVDKHVDNLKEEGIKVKVQGDLSEDSVLSEDIREYLLKVNDIEVENPRLTVNLCINYGGRDEIVRAAKELNSKNKEITEDSLTEVILKDDLPLDLIVRTGGDQRISNFLLWQSAYAEILFVDYYWPDIDEEKYLAIKSLFSNRDRRFGKIEE